MSLGELGQDEGRRKQAHELVSGVYGWFTEGFETRDLMKDAKALLNSTAVE